MYDITVFVPAKPHLASNFNTVTRKRQETILNTSHLRANFLNLRLQWLGLHQAVFTHI